MNESSCNLDAICISGYSLSCNNDDYILVGVHHNVLSSISSGLSLILGIYMIGAYISILRFFGLTLREKILLSIILLFSPHVYFASKHPKMFEMWWNA